jgi:hypothetical protein
MNRIQLAEDRVQGWAFMYIEMNLQISIKSGNFLTHISNYYHLFTEYPATWS